MDPKSMPTKQEWMEEVSDDSRGFAEDPHHPDEDQPEVPSGDDEDAFRERLAGRHEEESDLYDRLAGGE